MNSPSKGKSSIAMAPIETVVAEGQTRNSGVSGANSNEKLGSQGRIKKGKTPSISSPN